MADALSIYGAAIGSVAALGVLHNMLRDRTGIKIRLGREFYASKEAKFALVSFDSKSWDQTAGQYPRTQRKAHLQVVNSGRRPVTILEAGVEFADGTHAAFKPGTTSELTEGGFVSFRVGEEALGEAIKRSGIPAKVYATDGSGRSYRRSVEAKLRPWLEQLRREVTQS